MLEHKNKFLRSLRVTLVVIYLLVLCWKGFKTWLSLKDISRNGGTIHSNSSLIAHVVRSRFICTTKTWKKSRILKTKWETWKSTNSFYSNPSLIAHVVFEYLSTQLSEHLIVLCVVMFVYGITILLTQVFLFWHETFLPTYERGWIKLNITIFRIRTINMFVWPTRGSLHGHGFKDPGAWQPSNDLSLR